MAFTLISGCITSPMTKELLNSNLSIPTLAEIETTPFFPQEEYQCGPAALATILNYRHVSVTPNELTPYIYIPDKKGSLQVEMTATARRYGLLAYPIAPDLQDLFTEVAAGNPVLVMQNLSFSWYPMWHYAVVIGYDINTKTIVLRSGKTKRWKVSFAAFENTWKRSNYWGLVIVTPTQIPAVATELSYLSAAHDLETTKQLTASITAYRSAVARWPEKPTTWLALGNALYTQQQYTEASKVFSQGLMHHHNNGNLWNNYAYALYADGCIRTAQQALQAGLKIHPNDANLLDSQKQLLTKQPAKNKKQCATFNN